MVIVQLGFLEIALPKFFLRPDHSNGVQTGDLLWRQDILLCALCLNPMIEPVTVITLVSGRNLKISVCPVGFLCVPEPDFSWVFLLLHPRKMKNFQPLYGFRGQLPPVESLTLTVYPGGDFPFLVRFGTLFCGQGVIMKQIVGFCFAETGFPRLHDFPKCWL